jgi:hypothetical protein
MIITMTQVKRKYEAKILAILQAIKEALQEDHWRVCDPFEMSDDGYSSRMGTPRRSMASFLRSTTTR